MTDHDDEPTCEECFTMGQIALAFEILGREAMATKRLADDTRRVFETLGLPRERSENDD